MLALEALAVIVAWHGFNWLNQPPPGPETWLEAGKPLTDMLPSNPTGTTTIDVEAEDTEDVCISNAEAIHNPERGVSQPLFCFRNRKHHSISINRRPVATARHRNSAARGPSAGRAPDNGRHHQHITSGTHVAGAVDHEYGAMTLERAA